MCITIGLTTIRKFATLAPLRTSIRVRSLGRLQRFNLGRPVLALIPLICVIKRSISSPAKEPSPCPGACSTVPPWPAGLPIHGLRRARERKLHICQAQETVSHHVGPPRRAEYHGPFTLLNVSLGYRRLECKQNLQTNCPQNRLRVQTVGRGRRPHLGGRRAPFRPRSDPNL